MSTQADDETGGREPRTDPEETATIEAYETDEGMVFYDAENPLAWVETSQTIALEELA